MINSEIGVMSSTGSNCNSAWIAGAVVMAAVLISKVWPSASAMVKAVVPIMEPAPGWFWMTTGWPQICSSSMPMARAVVSVDPPVP